MENDACDNFVIPGYLARTLAVGTAVSVSSKENRLSEILNSHGIKSKYGDDFLPGQTQKMLTEC